MFNQFIKKKKKYDSYKPFSSDFKTMLNGVNHIDFAYMNLKLDGSKLTREGVNEIVKGNFIDHVGLLEHKEVEYHNAILKRFSEMNEWRTDLDIKELTKLYKILINKEEVTFRQSGETLYHLDYVPPFPEEIEDLLQKLFIDAFKIDFEGDFLRKAIFIHNKIIEIYPFEGKNETLARIAMEYELYKHGLPIIMFQLTESQYNTIVSEFLTNGDSENLYNNILQSSNIKLDKLIDILEDERNNS